MNLLSDRITFKRHLTYQVFNVIFIFILIKQLVFTFTIDIFHAVKWTQHWRMSEMLINYQGGFIRRGLLGEIIFQLCKWTHISPDFYVTLISLGFFFFVIGFILQFFKKRHIVWWLLACSLGQHMLFDIIRKDFISFSLIILIFWIYKKSTWGNYVKFGAITLVSVLMLLIYEPSFFMIIPFMVLLFFKKGNLKVHIGAKLLYVFVIMATMGVLFLFTGHKYIIAEIIQSWNGLFPHLIPLSHKSLDYSSINAIGWTTMDALKYNDCIFLIGSHVFDPPHLLWHNLFVRFWYLFVGPYYVIRYFYKLKYNGYTDNMGMRQGQFAALFIFQILCLLPLYLGLSCDHGRMLYYALVTVIILLHYLSTEEILSVLPHWYVQIVEKVDSTLDRYIPCNIYLITAFTLCLQIPFSRFVLREILFGDGRYVRTLTNFFY